MIDALPLLLGPEGYQISRSVRLRASAGGYFNRTPATTTNRKTFTYSLWVKRGILSASGSYELMNCGTKTISQVISQFNITGDKLSFETSTYGVSNFIVGTTAAVFRDPSAWYHIVFSIDTTQATNSNGVKIYVNGVQQTLTFSAYTQNYDTAINTNAIHDIGQNRIGTDYFDGYLTEINFIDGQALTPSSFGETNAVTGVWQPKKYAGTYGTNGFYLNFSDNSGATATTIGKDYSGNGNNWTPNNISVTAGVTYDSMLDVPTPYADGGNGRGNYCVLNPLDKNTNIALSEGNLTAIPSSTADYWLARATMAFPTTGKWYWELTLNNTPYLYQAGIYSSNRPNSGSISATGNEYQVAWGTAYTYIQFQSNNAAFAAWGTNTNPTSGNVLMFAYDADNATMWIGRNGTWYNTSGTANPATNTDPRFSSIPSGLFAGVNLPNPASGGVSMNFGQRPFAYTPPTGFVALNTQNLPTPTISNGASYMAATTYTGTGSALTIANTVGSASFQPDLVWVKSRSTVENNFLFDSVRGSAPNYNYLSSNLTNAEATPGVSMLTAINSNGFTLGTNGGVNTNAATFVGWQWNAGGSTVTNTSGTISAQVRANATAGFSVVTFTSTGSSGAVTVGHGLGVAPAMVITKERGAVGSWGVYHTGLTTPASQYLNLQTTGAATTNTSYWGNTNPTSTVVTLGNGTMMALNTTMVMYCFAAVAGYSAFGSYTGNGSADGPFVFLGFRPRFVMIKRTDTSGTNWYTLDTARGTYNANNALLRPNLSDAEISAVPIDFLSNGFKPRDTDAGSNASGGTFIYAAFCENPFKLSLAR